MASTSFNADAYLSSRSGNGSGCGGSGSSGSGGNGRSSGSVHGFPETHFREGKGPSKVFMAELLSVHQQLILLI